MGERTQRGRAADFLHRLIKEELETLISTTIGTVLTCFAIIALMMPYKFASGGVTGVALITNYLWGLSPVWVITVGNALLLLWGWHYLSMRFALWTLYVTILTSLVLPVFEMFQYPVIQEPLLAAILGGIIGGIGYGMLFRVDASSGGMDVVSAAARKRWGADIGTMSLYINLVILLVSFVAVSLEEVLFGALMLYVETLTIDNVVHSFHRRTQALIISGRVIEIKNYIMTDLERTATLIPAKGAYRDTPLEVLLVILPRRQIASLKRYIASLDPTAFVIFSEVSEVVGEGFKSWLRA